MPPQTKGQCLPATAIKKKPSTGFICTRGCGCFFRDRCWGADSHTEEDKEKWRREAELKQQLHQIRVEQTIARLSALQHLHEAASSTKKTGATNTTAGKKTSSGKSKEKQASDDSKSSKKAGATKPKRAFGPFVSLDSDSPAMKASFAKHRAAIQEEQAQAASQAAAHAQQHEATKKKEGSTKKSLLHRPAEAGFQSKYLDCPDGTENRKAELSARKYYSKWSAVELRRIMRPHDKGKDKEHIFLTLVEAFVSTKVLYRRTGDKGSVKIASYPTACLDAKSEPTVASLMAESERTHSRDLLAMYSYSDSDDGSEGSTD